MIGRVKALWYALGENGVCFRLCGLDGNTSDILKGAWFGMVISQTELLHGSSHCLQVDARVKFILEQATKAHKGSRGIAVPRITPWVLMVRDSLVGIATHYGLDGPEIKFC